MQYLREIVDFTGQDSDEWDSGFIHTSRMILEDVRQGWDLWLNVASRPQNIVILGHGQGGYGGTLRRLQHGMGSSLAASYPFGGPMPTFTQLEV